jgi:hypothetical protein
MALSFIISWFVAEKARAPVEVSPALTQERQAVAIRRKRACQFPDAAIAEHSFHS